MISKTYILENLRRLDVSYSRSSTSINSFYFSKLSILELCGWIEVSMDDIVIRHSSRKIRLPANHTFIERDVVRRTFGFDYDKHFRQMLIRLVGMVTVERIERCMNVGVQTRFKAELQSLKAMRDSLAHTYAKNPPPIDAPSRTKARFQPLYEGLSAYDEALRGL